ncbi:hypothetical protein [Mesorhizobium sp.]|uniref:DUF768 domain-containing protein n=1 Tax=Mesorhizobium sp. TaxID=1871066 RepID=UPI00344B5A4D
MSTRGTDFLHKWLSGKLDGLMSADVISVREAVQKLLADAKAVGIGEVEIEEDIGSVYEVVLDAIVHHDEGLASDHPDGGTMKRKPSKSGFNKLLDVDTTLLSAEPLIGLLELETDTGTIELAMNRTLAEQLLFAIVEFLQAGKGDDAPTFAIERSQ